MKIREFGNILFTIAEYFPIIFRIPNETADGMT